MKKNTLLIHGSKRKSQGKLKKKYAEPNKSENAMYLWDTAKVVLRGKFIALNVYIRKEKMSYINTLNSHFKNLEKENKNKPRVNSWTETIDFVGWLKNNVLFRIVPIKEYVEKKHISGLQNAISQLNENHKKIKLKWILKWLLLWWLR